MELFDDYEAIKFPEENMIFITHDEYLYYTYSYKYEIWEKCANAGYFLLTMENYPDISKDELTKAFGGVFPTKKTDILRLINPDELCISDLLDLLEEDYPSIWVGETVRLVHSFLCDSDIYHKSYMELRLLFDECIRHGLADDKIHEKIRELSYRVIGRDIYKKEIGIVDGHDSSSYFWIMPVRVIDYADTNSTDNVAEMRSNEISIEEDDIRMYLFHFLDKYFDDNLEANRRRLEYSDIEDSAISGFEWWLTHNFYTYDAIENIIGEIGDIVVALSSGTENEFADSLKKSVKADEIDMVIDFYQRFIYRMEYMMKVGKEKGYDHISFMGP